MDTLPFVVEGLMTLEYEEIFEISVFEPLGGFPLQPARDQNDPVMSQANADAMP